MNGPEGTRERIVTKLTLREWLKGVRSRKQASQNRVTTESILEARDADRK